MSSTFRWPPRSSTSLSTCIISKYRTTIFSKFCRKRVRGLMTLNINIVKSWPLISSMCGPSIKWRGRYWRCRRISWWMSGRSALSNVWRKRCEQVKTRRRRMMSRPRSSGCKKLRTRSQNWTHRSGNCSNRTGCWLLSSWEIWYMIFKCRKLSLIRKVWRAGCPGRLWSSTCSLTWIRSMAFDH